MELRLKKNENTMDTLERRGSALIFRLWSNLYAGLLRKKRVDVVLPLEEVYFANTLRTVM